MPIERFYINQPLNAGETCEIADQEFHHLVHVVRLNEGESIELINGKGQLAEGTLESIGKKKALIRTGEVKSEPPPSTQIILAQAIPRINRLDFIIEKGTELGMTQIWLFPSALGERKALTHHQLERLQSLAIAATKQCGRLYLPEIKCLPPLKKWAPLPCPAIFGDVRLSAPLFKGLSNPSKGIIVFVGPESGFTDEEVVNLTEMGAQGISLHTNILRTDTAALAALTLAHHYIEGGKK